jgi:murein DD-endopeptidase MepM/ murein hydrolase activator NlpD
MPARRPVSARPNPGRPGLAWRGVLAATAALLALGPAVAEPAPASLSPPVSPACVSSPFGPRILAGRPKAGIFHSGIDLPAPAGAAVRAVADGQVMAVRRRGAGGLFVLVRHNGFTAVYAHLGAVTPSVAEGRRNITAGEKLGVVGRTGVSYGAHIYFEMKIGEVPVDPAAYLGVAPCP